jgi:hypothetical protein
MHSSFYQKNLPPIRLDDRLFYCDVPENSFTDYGNGNSIKTEHQLYQHKAHRLLRVEDKKVVIRDWWSSDQSIETEWRFIVHPAIKAEGSGAHWSFYYKTELLAQLETEVDLRPMASDYSVGYGVTEKTTLLMGTKHIDSQKEIQHILFPAK